MYGCRRGIELQFVKRKYGEVVMPCLKNLLEMESPSAHGIVHLFEHFRIGSIYSTIFSESVCVLSCPDRSGAINVIWYPCFRRSEIIVNSRRDLKHDQTWAERIDDQNISSSAARACGDTFLTSGTHWYGAFFPFRQEFSPVNDWYFFMPWFNPYRLISPHDEQPRKRQYMTFVPERSSPKQRSVSRIAGEYCSSK